MSFANDLDKFAKKAQKQADQARREPVLQLFGSVIGDTPVGNPSEWKGNKDKPPSEWKNKPPEGYVGGALRGNWQTNVGSAPRGAIDRVDATGESSKADAAAAIAAWGDDQSVIMVNNLPYAIPVEDGSSTQSPNGMVAKNVKRFRPLVKQAARKYRK